MQPIWRVKKWYHAKVESLALMDVYEAIESRTDYKLFGKVHEETEKHRTRSLNRLRRSYLMQEVLFSRFIGSLLIIIGVMGLYIVFFGNIIASYDLYRLFDKQLVIENYTQYFNQRYELLLKTLFLLVVLLLVFLTVWKGSISNIVTPWGTISLNKTIRSSTKELLLRIEDLQKFNNDIDSLSWDVVQSLIKDFKDETKEIGLYTMIEYTIKSYSKYMCRCIKTFYVTVDLSEIASSANYSTLILGKEKVYIVYGDKIVDELDKNALENYVNFVFGIFQMI